MKISKLFHWLYALVMLLPIFAIGVSCGYAILNKNAYQSYTDNFPEKNYINSMSNFNTGTRYYVLGQLKDEEITNANSPYGILYDGLEDFYTTRTLDYVPASSGRFNFTYYGGHNYIQFLNNDGTSQGQAIDLYQQTVYFSFKYLSGNLNDSQLPSNVIYSNLSGGTLNNVFYSSISQLKNSTLFNWSYNSFLAQPILFITGLFSIPNNHIVVYLLSYWLAISIIWLVFDLIMYVPLLVHRWLDKGVLE